ncbi:MinD/ParA family protein [Lentibacillus sp. Marseille-P4043]|uniref:MinD/ParA family protein n=1 Tax=Lentibacillus sp. Marseille-P4043 TaxID=2040293 RepID=UPI000D0B0547|nr:MinD/ParA family protein [Lentibacillus sp. Marseille-P4043]
MKHDQAASLRRKLTIAQDPKQAKTIAIVSGKGGVGKSNFALNFSLELRNNQKTVLLFDLDVGMGNIDILLGLQSERTIVDMFNDRLSIHDIIEEGPNQLHYIAAGSGLSDFFTMDQAKIDFFLDQYNELVQMYDYIIFDMGAGATHDSLQFVMASDECIVITTPEPTSITDAYGMIKHILNNKQNMPIYVVMNRSLSTKQGTKALERFQRVVSQFLQVNVSLMGVLPDDKTVTTAVIRQIPYVLLNEKAAISKAVKQVAANYLAKSFSLTKKEPFSFVQKLKQLMIER